MRLRGGNAPRYLSPETGKQNTVTIKDTHCHCRRRQVVSGMGTTCAAASKHLVCYVLAHPEVKARVHPCLCFHCKPVHKPWAKQLLLISKIFKFCRHFLSVNSLLLCNCSRLIKCGIRATLLSSSLIYRMCCVPLIQNKECTVACSDINVLPLKNWNKLRIYRDNQRIHADFSFIGFYFLCLFVEKRLSVLHYWLIYYPANLALVTNRMSLYSILDLVVAVTLPYSNYWETNNSSSSLHRIHNQIQINV